MGFEVILGIVAGLGLFLYGMKLMSDGLQKVAGTKMRMVLETLTKNRFIGVIVGFLFTAVIQSSSATTVLEVSFVDSGLMSLTQSVGVTMGANIGTTMTGQLIAFKLSYVAPFILMMGVIMMMFTKRSVIQKLGEVLLGFGMLFFGLETMADAMGGMDVAVKNAIASLDNVYIAILVGFLVTAVLQSSSATTGIVMVMAATPITAGSSTMLVTLQMSFYLILGCNMGSCVSALLASIPGGKEAKRTAMVHFLFNIIGSSLVVICLGFFEPQIQDIIRKINSDPMSCVANANTIFKLSQVIVLFPFGNMLVRLSRMIIRGEDKKKSLDYNLLFIGEGHTINPTTALPMAISEIEHMCNLTKQNLITAIAALQERSEKKVEHVYAVEEEIDFLNTEISNYLVSANQMELPMEDRKYLGNIFHVVNDIERIGDRAENIADFAKTCIEKNITFSKKAMDELNTMKDMVLELFDLSVDMFCHGNMTNQDNALLLEENIDKLEKKLQKKHVNRLTKGKCEPHAAMIYTDLLANMERIADHGINIAFGMKEDKEFIEELED